MAKGEFWDFQQEPVVPGSVYIIGRTEMGRCDQKIRDIISRKIAHIIFINAAEASETMMGQFISIGCADLAFSGQLPVIAGGPVDDHVTQFSIEYFLIRLHDFQENLDVATRTPEIYTKKPKPYKFLFLNGRIRHHRKWLLEKLRMENLLEQSLWTCLDQGAAPNRHIRLMDEYGSLMHSPSEIRTLPPQYEYDLYQHNTDLEFTDPFVKYQLFEQEWGEAYIKPEPYIDTYFSLVTETLFDGNFSFRTEKIWKPIIMGHPWIAVSSNNFYRDLQGMGFQTFDGIIDESFDGYPDPQARIEKIYQEVNRLCHSDLDQFLDQCRDICIYNQAHARKLAADFKKSFARDFLKFIESIVYARS